MKLKIIVVTIIIILYTFAQNNQLVLTTPAPPMVNNVSVTRVSGGQGTSNFCYWVIAKYPIGNSFPNGSGCINNVANNVTLLISWNLMLGAIGYDIIRGTTSTFPQIPCTTCLVSSNQTTTSFTDNLSVGTSYSVTSAIGATSTTILDNTNFTSPRVINNMLWQLQGLVVDNNNLLYNNIALPQPSAITVSQHGVLGVVTYGYQVAFNGLVGSGLPSTEQQITTGNAILNSSNYNIITSPTCPFGVTTYSVWRSTDPNGNTGQISFNSPCGISFNDQGYTLTPTNFIAATTYDQSVGVYIGKKFTMNSSQLFIGSPYYNFSNATSLDGDLNTTFPHTFSFQSLSTSFNDPNLNLYVITELAQSQIGGAVFATFGTGTNASATARAIQSIEGFAANSGTQNMGVVTGAVGYVATFNTGNITAWGAGFLAANGYNASSGTIANYTGFGCLSTLSVATGNNTCFYSNESAGTGHYHIYAPGTAQSLFGGTIINTSGGIQISIVAVASLPTCNAGAEGLHMGVNNSNAVSYTAGIGTVVAGGGTTHVPVYCDGTNWRIG